MSLRQERRPLDLIRATARLMNRSVGRFLSGNQDPWLICQNARSCGVCLRAQTPRKATNPGMRVDGRTVDSIASWRTNVLVRTAIVRLSCCWMAAAKLHSGVHRRQSILPFSKENRWRPYLREYTRRASAVSSPPQETDPSGTFSCDRFASRDQEPPDMSLHYRMQIGQACRFDTCRFRSARQPFRCEFAARHHPLTRINDHPTALQVYRSIPAATSVAGFIDFYSGHTPPLRRLKHVTDQVTHRGPTRLPQRFLR